MISQEFLQLGFSLDETVVFSGNMNDHVGRINTAYAEVHDGFGCGIRDTCGSRIWFVKAVC